MEDYVRTLGIILALTVAAAMVTAAGKTVAPEAAAAAASTALPQAPAGPDAAVEMKTFATSADVQSLLAKAKAERKEGQGLVPETILSLAPYAAHLEYRPATAPAAVHETEAELVYVIDGTGTLTTGGTVVGEKRLNPSNLSGTAIDGGNIQAVAKGDFAIIPENTPHQFKPSNGPLVLMTMHVPRPVGAAK